MQNQRLRKDLILSVFGIGMIFLGLEEILTKKVIAQEIEKIKIIDDFSKKSEENWEVKFGIGMDVNSEFGYQFPGTIIKSAKIEMKRKEGYEKGKAEEVWVSLSRLIEIDSSWKDADGIIVELKVDRAVRSWWIDMHISCEDGSGFSQPLQPLSFFGMWENRILYFKTFKPKGTTTGELKPENISKLTISMTGINNILYLKEIALYKEVTQKRFIKFSTNKPNSNVFEKDEPIELNFSLDTVPLESAGFKFIVKDYFEKIVLEKFISWKDISGNSFTLQFTPSGPGFYEVSAYLKTVKGEFEKRSSIISTGSIPPGIGTFAIMPGKIEENKNLMKYNSFFGFHNATHNLYELTGCAWGIWAPRWANLEPDGPPGREDGIAKWAKDIINSKEPYPQYIFYVATLAHQFTPKWASSSPDDPEYQYYPPKDWKFFSDFFRDIVRVYKHLFPHMKPRIYDLVWEPEVYMAPFARKEILKPEDLVKRYEIAKEIIKTEDSSAILIAPCRYTVDATSEKSVQWYKNLFEAGLLKYIDGISIHPYHSPPPEEANLSENIKALQELVKKYKGKTLPIWALEQGYPAVAGTEHRYREQSRYILRSNLIFQGEGLLRINCIFYGYDYPEKIGSNLTFGYGICFNLDEILSWPAKRIAPKPAVSAIATQVFVLNNAKPICSITKGDIWGYLFEKNKEPILVVWTHKQKKKIKIPVGSESITLIDMMGNSSVCKTEKGELNLEISEDPQYILGSNRNLWLETGKIPEFK